MDFNKGLKDGIPVALGYFSVSIAFGPVSYTHLTLPTKA